METVSSPLTFLYKFVISALWFSGIGVGAIAMFLRDQPELGLTGSDYAAIWLVVSALVWWKCARLKRVDLDGSILEISNYRDAIRVHATDIASVRQNRKSRSVTITFKRPTQFGRAIVFKPQVSFRIFSEHEVVNRLRTMAGIR